VGTIDIEAVRSDTPGCMEIIHLNNAGASLVPDPVLAAMADQLRTESRVGGYEAASSRAEVIDRVYHAGARLLQCRSEELAFTTGGTQGWWAALNSVKLVPGDRVLASSAEYNANVFGLIQLRSRGIEVDIIPDDRHGQVSVENLRALLDERVKLVCCTHIPTYGGVINPVAEVGAVVADTDAFYLVDATQSAGQLPVSVDEIKCDFLVLTGRKYLRAPRGSGLLYVRSGLRGLLDPRVLDGRSARWTSAWSYELVDGARRFEVFETDMAAKVGLGVAIDYALRIGLDPIAKRVGEVADQLRDRLRRIPLVNVVDGSGPQSGIVTFHVDGRPSEAVVAALRAWGINTSLIDHHPAAFDPTGKTRNGLIRASVHYYNTAEELDVAVAAL
jgi:selenocysteine lyase/cysteine desulfurase